MGFAHIVEHIFQLRRLLFGKAHVAVFALAEEGDFARFFSSANTIASSPAFGTSDKPRISTGMDGKLR